MTKGVDHLLMGEDPVGLHDHAFGFVKCRHLRFSPDCDSCGRLLWAKNNDFFAPEYP
jgi:hypothetical protein